MIPNSSVQGSSYFHKGIFPRATSQGKISQVATSKMCNFQSCNFSEALKDEMGGGPRALRLGWDTAGRALL